MGVREKNTQFLFFFLVTEEILKSLKYWDLPRLISYLLNFLLGVSPKLAFNQGLYRINFLVGKIVFYGSFLYCNVVLIIRHLQQDSKAAA